MAVCCILVAILMAQISATLRRWGIFWGVVQPEPGEPAETLVKRAQAWLALPKVKAGVFAVVAVEAVVAGGWIYTAHGSHLYRLGDEAVGWATGRQIVYAPLCTAEGRGRYVRLVLDSERGRLHRTGPTPLS